MQAKALESVYFAKIPEGTVFSGKAFKVDPAIPLPIQKKTPDAPVETDVANLSQEQILSGILAVLAYDKNNEYTSYYRNLITQVRPNIKKELAEAAILKARDEDWELAEEIWLSVEGIDPKDRAITLNKAVFFDQRADCLRRNALEEDADAYDALALENYKRALECADEIPDAYFNAGFFYLKKRNYSEAKACFESYVALLSDVSDEKLGENGIYKRDRAQELVWKITNRNLENARFKRAHELIEAGKEQEGIEEIRKFLLDNPAVWNAWFLLGWGLRRLARFSDAKAAFLKAQECEGGDENADTLNELAICQMETGEIDRAKQTLQEALQLDGDNTKIIANLACLCLKTGDIEEAKRYFRVVLELDPKDKIAQDQLARLEGHPSI